MAIERQDDINWPGSRAVCAVGRLSDERNVAEHQMNNNGRLKVCLSPFELSTERVIGKVSGGDFAVAFTSTDTLTFSSLPASHPTMLGDDIVAVVQIDANGLVSATYDRFFGFSVTAGVLTVTNPSSNTAFDPAFDASSTYIVYTNVRFS